MIIRSIYIKEFGAITGRQINLQEGLNIIEGGNESGKSTLLAFIKFMLYGLPKKAAGEVVTEKDRAFSWSGGIASGSMTVETEGGVFRIERSAKESSRSETPKIYDAETGEQVYGGENPGELFFGVPLNVFESTACVKQLSCGRLDGSGLGTAIENLMVAADENTSVKKASSKLDSIRKKLMHKSGRGGEITEIEDRVAVLQAQIDRAGQRARHLESRSDLLDSTEQIIVETKRKVEEEKALSRAYDLRQTQIRFDALHSAEKRVEGLKVQEKTALENGPFGGRLPTEQEISAISESRVKYLQAKESRIRAEEGLAELERQNPPRDEIDLHAARMNEAGGERAVIEDYSSRQKLATRYRKIGLVLSVLALAAVVVTALFLLSVSFLPTLLPSGKGVKIAVAAAAALVCVICAALTIHVLIRAKRLTGSCSDLAESIGCDENSREALVVRLAALRHRISERESFEGMMGRLRNGILSAAQAETLARELLERQLEELGFVGDTRDADPAEKVLCVTEEFRALSEEVGELRRDIDKYSALAHERREELSVYDEEEIRRAVTPELEEKLAEVNITLLRRDLEFQQAKLESAQGKKQAAEREIITLQATFEDPEKLAVELEEQKKLLLSRRFMHDSLTLATESIAEASESVRRNITPGLRRHAGEILERLTDGRYKEIAISPDFTVSVTADGVTRPVEALSSGTRDAVYLAIRLALVTVLYRNEAPALLLDEILSQIDDTRAKNILEMLTEYTKNGTQCLLFTCHSRESAMSDAQVVKM